MRNDSGDRVERASGRLRPRWTIGLFALILVLVLASCSSADDSADSAEEASSFDGDADAGGDESFEFDGDDEAMEEEEAAEDAAMEDVEADVDAEVAREPSAGAVDDGAEEGEGPLGAGGTSVTPTAADLGRQLIFTAFLSVGVDDVAASSAEATTIIENLGGFLFGQSTEGGPNARSELIFKVLPNDFNLALERLGSVGELRNQTVTTDDVTERVVDLRSRIEVAELGVDRLRAALEGTQSLEDYAEVERLLLSRESELEVMRGQLRTLQDRIDLATITLVLSQERVENSIRGEVTTYEGHDDGRACPGQPGRSVEEGSDVTVCFEVTNTGDQTLTDIALTDSVLEIDAETELIPVFGEIDQLAPGQSALLAFETRVERTIRLRTRVVAVPTDGVDPDPTGPAVNSEGQAEVRTFPSEEAPGFGDGFGVAVDVLRGLWTAFTVTLGFLIPLLVLAPFVWLAWKLIGAGRARRPRRGGPSQLPPVAPPPPPPPTTGETPVGAAPGPEGSADGTPPDA